ncbi:hypothetical protein EDD37DRAFT_330230 [Exophiala viscosa]|uniref:uncharacterized protein n=1 Tax=Exophiala viscosa TaxID=2486360 RepID=UPI00218D8264|nr:hypothetical protein EDD37DRAFT_330230 [Exophiala viscosa]
MYGFFQTDSQHPSARTSTATRPSTTVSRSTGYTFIDDESPRLSVALGPEFVIPDHLLFSESTLVESFSYWEGNSGISLDDSTPPPIPPKSIHRRRHSADEMLSTTNGAPKGHVADAPRERDGTVMGTCKKNAWGSKFSEDLQSERQEIPRGAPAPAPAPDVPRHVAFADSTTVEPVSPRRTPLRSDASHGRWRSPSPFVERKWRGLRLKELLCMVD